jgi:hypothetical protein
MAEQSSRPFYGEYAWAFDLLIDRPVGQECAAITAWFSERGSFFCPKGTLWSTTLENIRATIAS